MPRRRPVLMLALFTVLISSALQSQPVPPPGKCGSTNNLNWVMYYRSFPHTSPNCSLAVQGDGRIVVSGTASNPAMSCSDMFAWKLLLSANQDIWWTRYATDETTWPPAPLALCGPGQTTNCCNPANLNGDPCHCPTFPGAAIPAPSPKSASPNFNAGARLLVAKPPIKAHIVGLPTARLLKSISDDDEDTDRVIRQSMAEVVYRNQPMLKYTFENNLYNQEGLISVYNNANAVISANTPYRTVSTTAKLTTIDYPTEALMLKTDWIRASKAKEWYGLEWDPNNPYIAMPMQVTLDDGSQATEQFWLVGVHVSSKDIPNWVWTTFEHVNNPGRCDYIGCNDAYGFLTPDPVKPGQWQNYTASYSKCDNLENASWIWNSGKKYPGGTVTPALGSVLTALNIKMPPVAAPPPVNSYPTPTDAGWRSMRLKGTQTEFTDSMGRDTLLGNSITEAGFVTTSSCITCHARASVNGKGTIPLPIGVFTLDTTEVGYLQSVHGSPNPDLYNQDAQPPGQLTLQTDFVWGVLNAACITCTDACKAVGLCNTCPDATTDVKRKKLRATVR